MKCPACNFPKDKVIDSRLCKDGQAIRRRRECLQCHRRYTTYEYIESALMVIKKDGRREAFDRNKIISGILKACEKRPVSVAQLEEAVDRRRRGGLVLEQEVPDAVDEAVLELRAAEVESRGDRHGQPFRPTAA